jgi:alpha-D-ribose 1-methylphosphonate 5-triphosphate synthase subunit PhnH
VVGPDGEALARVVAEMTRSPFTEVAGADFIIVTQGSSQGKILEAKRGTLEYPDQGATILYLVESLGQEGSGGLLAKLQSPGREAQIQARVRGLHGDEILWLRQVNQDFPLGVDCFLVDRSGRVMGIPRATRVEVH